MNIYWLIAIMPEWLTITFIVVGVFGLLAAMFISKAPFIKQYNLPITIVAVVLLVLGVFLQGALAYKHSTDAAVAELKLKLVQAEAKSAQTNTEIVEKIVKDTLVIRQKGKSITEYIDREIPVYNDRCELPVEVIRAHNAAATMDPSKLEGEPK